MFDAPKVAHLHKQLQSDNFGLYRTISTYTRKRIVELRWINQGADERENVSVAHRIFKQQQASGSMEFVITARMSLVLLQATVWDLTEFSIVP